MSDDDDVTPGEEESPDKGSEQRAETARERGEIHELPVELSDALDQAAGSAFKGTELVGLADVLGRSIDPSIVRGISSAMEGAFRTHNDLAKTLGQALLPVFEAQRSIMGTAIQAQEWANALNQSIAPALGNMAALMGQLSANIAPAVEAMRTVLRTIDFSSFVVRLVDLLPPNWPADIKYEVALQILNEVGIPLVWVPRAELVVMIIDAADEATQQKVLVDNQGLIIADVRSCLTQAWAVEGLRDYVDLVREAADAYEAGFTNAAQALATTVLDSLVTVYVGTHNSVQKLPKVDDDVEIRDFVRTAALSPLIEAYQPYWPAKGDPVPVRYNRHATVHGGSTAQFSRVNSLIALMLVTSFLRTIADAEAIEDDAA